MPAIRAHLEHCWRSAYGPLLSQEQLDQLTKSLNSQDLGGLWSRTAIALGAYENTTLIGTGFGAQPVDTAFFWGMYVHPDQTRKGLGTAILDALAARFPQAEQLSIMVLKDRPSARAFYAAGTPYAQHDK